MRCLWSNKLILDVWCNTWYLWKTDQNNNSFYGIEYDSNVIDDAKKEYVDAIQYDLNHLNQLPWDIKFDTIIFADVLEHVVHPDKVLLFMKNYLKQDGNIILSLPNIANWQVRFNLLFGKFNYTDTGIMDNTHLHFYTFKTAKDLLKKNWYTIKHTFWWASFFGPLIRFLPFLKSLLATNIIYYAKK